MGDHSAIGWTEATWNPTTGCSKVSPGCDNCYAIRSSVRLVAQGVPAYRGVLTGDMRDWSGRVNEVPSRLEQPLRWQKPRLIFVNSMSDLFHPEVSSDFIAEVFAVMALADQHAFQVLTKRPKRMAKLLANDAFQDDIDSARLRRDPYRIMPDWPRPNIWMGVSIESADQLWRADDLRATPAAVRWLSLEPLLGPLSLDLTGVDWVVVGGESGPGHRYMNPYWLYHITAQCAEADVPVFVKQDSGPRSGQQGQIPDEVWARKDYPKGWAA